VHYPGDVIAGSVTGGALAPIVTAAVERRRARRSGATGYAMLRSRPSPRHDEQNAAVITQSR
jgi:hypothetical protein